jgi:co-chaperonin GroES (HSP10)
LFQTTLREQWQIKELLLNYQDHWKMRLVLNPQKKAKTNRTLLNLMVLLLRDLPQPTGYRILIIPYYPSEKTKGGLFIPDATREREGASTVCAYVVRLGPDAYKDTNKFPSGSWCSEKTWVLIGRYAGNRFKVDGLEVRIINDDNVIATILDPTDISYV